MKPSLRQEKILARQGFEVVVGIDEAGRGPLAGPVVACALAAVFAARIMKREPQIKKLLKEVRDSKKLTPKKREELFFILTRHLDIKWATGLVSEKVIDKINILEATKLAMKRAVQNLINKYSDVRPPAPVAAGPASRYRSRRLWAGIRIAEAHPLRRGEDEVKRAKARFSDTIFLILDGNIKIDLPIWQTSIVKADEKVFSCACASIVAKVTRDKMMQRYHKKYPQYGFNQHKGYGTKQHMGTLKKYGPCEIHRKSFRPVRKTKNKI